MGDKISVIVPIYNVEPYLRRCIDSIINQTYENLEIILVDDGSPDNCGQICDDYAKKDTRIKVIHKKNGGLSDARNAGMKIATGDYIGFVDSDDWIHENMYEILLYKMIENNTDISECNVKKVFLYKEVDIKKYIDINQQEKITLLSKNDAMDNLVSEEVVKQTVWNKLYKRQVIEDIFFEKGKLHEDEYWTYKVINKINKVVYIDIDLYYYFQREGSIMSQKYSLKRLDALEGRYRRYQLIMNNYPDITTKAKINIFYTCIHNLQQALLTNEKKLYIETFNIVNKYMLNIEFNMKDMKHMRFKDTIWILISKISLVFCCKIRNRFNIGVK